MHVTKYNTLARAKLVPVKNTGLFKLLAAFNVTQRSELTGRYRFPTEAKCDFVSGHVTLAELGRVLESARSCLGSSRIELQS